MAEGDEGSTRARRRYPPPEGAWYDIMQKSDLVRPLEAALVRWTGASLVTYATRVRRDLPYIPTLLLTTVGRHSGELREAALGYYARGGEVVLCGSRGGAAQHPQWYENLQAHPLAWVCVNRQQVAVDTRTAEGDEHDELWEWIKQMVPEYAAYERRAAGSRQLPLVVCTPRRPVRLSPMR